MIEEWKKKTADELEVVLNETREIRDAAQAGVDEFRFGEWKSNTLSGACYETWTQANDECRWLEERINLLAVQGGRA